MSSNELSSLFSYRLLLEANRGDETNVEYWCCDLQVWIFQSVASLQFASLPEALVVHELVIYESLLPVLSFLIILLVPSSMILLMPTHHDSVCAYFPTALFSPLLVYVIECFKKFKLELPRYCVTYVWLQGRYYEVERVWLVGSKILNIWYYYYKNIKYIFIFYKKSENLRNIPKCWCPYLFVE